MGVQKVLENFVDSIASPLFLIPGIAVICGIGWCFRIPVKLI
jgi:hypothetical protein